MKPFTGTGRIRNYTAWVDCNDGFGFSVVAGDWAYCLPETYDVTEYTHVEIGYPTESDVLIDKYQRDEDIYVEVPVAVVAALIRKHGGMPQDKIAELPPGISAHLRPAHKPRPRLPSINPYRHRAAVEAR
jgi:hypothetical protein